ncbi:MAG TPA: hypothetical protein VKH37_00150, partial [Ferruginibacter sp.]|nr:hypothetical protein [Ferruginibacter sp.]
MSTNTINVSVQMMDNYKLADGPDLGNKGKGFTALQDIDGNSLLFGIDSGGVFNLFQETPNQPYGFTVIPLSTAQINAAFPNGGSCTNFAAAQNVAAAANNNQPTLSIAMVVTDDTNHDHVFICTGLSIGDLSWTTGISWSRFEYDNPLYPLDYIKVANLHLMETAEGNQVIVIDLLSTPTDPQQSAISRYYLDPKEINGYAWVYYQLASSFDAAGCISSIGNPGNQGRFQIQGIYTCGTVNNSPEFQYQALYDIYSQLVPPGPALPCNYSLQDNAVPQSMAVCRNADDTTDVYLTGFDGTNWNLYYLASTNQGDNKKAARVFSNELFNNVQNLYAHATSTEVKVWGLNQANQVFYITCPVGSQTMNYWTNPIPILLANNISTYINNTDGGLTYFASLLTAPGDPAMVMKLTKSTDTLIWKQQSLHILPQ